MAGYVALGAIVLFVIIGIVDSARGQRMARLTGIAGLVFAGYAASHAVWHLFAKPEIAELPLGILATLSVVAVTLGLVADWRNDHRTKAVGAPLALIVTAWLLSRAVERPPSTGAVLFVAAMGLFAGSLGGGLLNRGLRTLRDRLESDDDRSSAGGSG